MIILKLKIGANNAQMGFNFVPILGQYSINIKDFCLTFNQKTNIFFKNIPLNVKLYLLKNNKYIIYYRIPLAFFINFYKINNNINLYNIYNIMYLYFIFNNKHIFYLSKGFARTVYAVIKTMKLNIIL